MSVQENFIVSVKEVSRASCFGVSSLGGVEGNGGVMVLMVLSSPSSSSVVSWFFIRF